MTLLTETDLQGQLEAVRHAKKLLVNNNPTAAHFENLCKAERLLERLLATFSETL